MCEVVVLHAATRFDPARWVSQWEVLGGQLFLGDAFDSIAHVDGSRLVALSQAMVTPEIRRRVDLLKTQLTMPGNRGRVQDFVERRKATRGW